MIRKYASILALSLSAVLFLPEVLFAQGSVVGYAVGQEWFKNHPQDPLTAFPADAQLDRLTHVIASGGIGCNNNGSLWTNELPNNWSNGTPPGNTWNNGNKNLWLENLVSRAHQKGVKVSIMVGGDYFRNATNSTYLSAFVGNIVNFVNLHSLDGVDIDWEPARDLTATDWDQCINLLNTLKNHSQLSGKRISIALPHSNWFYLPNQAVQQNIWNAADAIHLMTYDVEDGAGGWPSHSDAAYSIGGIDNWIAGGTPNAYKEKLFLGCAFYGYMKDSNGKTLYGENNKVSYATYFGGGNYNPGDNATSVVTKANYCLNNGYGGVFAWELGYDVAATGTNPPSLLNAIWNARPTITGPDIVCYPGSTFTLNNPPPGTITWSVTYPFTVSGTGATATVTLDGVNHNNGTLTASVNGTVVATKTIMPCLPSITGPGVIPLCGSNITYTANIPNPVWALTGFVKVSETNTTVTVRNSSSGSSSIQAVYNRSSVLKTVYKTNVPVIGGPDRMVYGTSSIYTITSGHTVSSWTVSSGFQIISYSSRSATVRPTTPNNVRGTLTANITCNGGTIPVRKSIETSTPYIAPTVLSCSGNTVINLITNGLPLSNIHWIIYGNLRIISGQGTSQVTVSHTGTPPYSINDYTGAEYVKVQYSVPGGASSTADITLYPSVPEYCPPIECTTDEGWSLCPGDWFIYTAQDYDCSSQIGYLTPTMQHAWYRDGTLVATTPLSITGIYQYLDTDNEFYLRVEAWFPKCGYLGSDGYGQQFEVGNCDEYYFAYPNPASSTLNIEIDTNAQSQSSVPAVTSGKQLKVDKTFDIRLHDGQGNLLRQQKTKGGKVEFNVANLPDGIYYLHIYDGVSSKPEMRQIVVEH